MQRAGGAALFPGVSDEGRRRGPAPEGAKRGHGRGLAERTEAGGGELCRTRPRRRICIRRAGRRTHKSTALHREHGCPDRDRTLEGRTHQHRTSTRMRSKPHVVRQTSTASTTHQHRTAHSITNPTLSQIWYNSNTKGWKPERPVKTRRCRAAVKAGMRPRP